MHYLNIHTHHPLHDGETTINAFGVHPWHLNDDATNGAAQVKEHIRADIRAAGMNVLRDGQGHPFAIGECGLDRLTAIPYDVQLAAFQAQIELSEELGCPLILHCVRAVDDVLRMKHGTRQAWIFHGFRGKPQQMLQLLDHGFYISFGLRHNAESLSLCPAERLFLETDDTPLPISSLYATAAAQRGTTPEALAAQCLQNLSSIGLTQTDLPARQGSSSQGTRGCEDDRTP